MLIFILPFEINRLLLVVVLVWSQHEILENCTVPYGQVWSCMIPYCPYDHIYGQTWSYMVPYGPIWYHMVQCGPEWHGMALYCPV